MAKTTGPLSQIAKSVSSAAAIATLAALDAITAGSVLAQQMPGQPSPTLQRLERLQRLEYERRSAEDAKWRSFPSHYATSISPRPKCEFYWPGWELRPDGTRATRVRGRSLCAVAVAVDCRSLKVSWRDHRGWGDWKHPIEKDRLSIETGRMVAELCDNIAPSVGNESQPQTAIASLPARPSITSISEAKPSLLLTSSWKCGSINVGAEGKQILQLLGEMGVETVIKDECPKPGTLGAYSRFDNLLVLCKASLKYPALATEVIAHEAVHALQDCIQPGGIKGSASRSLTSFFRVFNEGKHAARFEDLLREGLANRPNMAAYLRDLKTSMPPNMFLMEREAYALEIYPKSVALLLKNIGIPLCRPLE